MDDLHIFYFILFLFFMNQLDQIVNNFKCVSYM